MNRIFKQKEISLNTTNKGKHNENEASLFEVKCKTPKCESILEEVLRIWDTSLTLPSLHKVLDVINPNNIEQASNALSLLISMGADVDEENEAGECILDRMLKIGMMYLDDRINLSVVLEMILNNSQIDYNHYKNGDLLTLLKNYSIIHFIQWRLSNETEEEFLELIEHPDYRLHIEACLYQSAIITIGQGYFHVFKRVLEIDTDKIFGTNEIIELFRKAIRVGELEIMKFLFEKEITPNMIQIPSILSFIVRELIHVKESDRLKFYECFDYILRSSGIDVNEKDESGNVALYYACKYDDEYIIKELLRAKAYLGSKNNDNEMAITWINKKKFEDYLNSCLRRTLCGKHKYFNSNDHLAFFDYNCFVPVQKNDSPVHPKNKIENDSNQVTGDMEVINHISRNPNLQDLIDHPLIRAFIFLKWKIFHPVIFLLHHQCYFCFMLIGILILCAESTGNPWIILFSNIFVLMFIVITTLLEGLRCIFLRHSYFFNSVNILNLSNIIMTFYYLLDNCISFNGIRQCKDQTLLPPCCKSHLGFMALLWSLNMTLLLYSFVSKKIGIYFAMLLETTYNTLVAIFSCIFLYIGFSLAFYVMFGNFRIESDAAKENNDINSFNDFGISCIKVMLMFTGELDAAAMNYENSFSYILLTIFVFFGPIIAFNLLHGIAVDDVQVRSFFSFPKKKPKIYV